MKLLLLPILALVTSCSSLTGAVSAIQMVGSANHVDLPRPDYQYKKGDKIELYSSHSEPLVCEVLYANSNPYSDKPMMAKYEAQCQGEQYSRTITSEQIERNQATKVAYLKKYPDGINARKQNYKPAYEVGAEVTYYNYDDDKTSKCTVSKIDDPGLGKSQITYGLTCPDEEHTVYAEETLLRAGRKIASDRAAGKGITRAQSMNNTIKSAQENRKAKIREFGKLMRGEE